MSTKRRHLIDGMLACLVLAIGLAFASPAIAVPWTEPSYLYRYFAWGVQRPFSSRSDDYQLYGYHTIDVGTGAFHFRPGERALMPDTVQYQDGNQLKRFELSKLLSSTGTHAFIVARDNQLLYENYFNGSTRDALGTSWSLSKSFVSALVGVAISEGLIKSLDDPITTYLPELKDRGFDPITIRDLLTMGSGIQYRFGLFPWDEFVLQGYYPNLRRLLLSDLKIIEPPGQAFHYNNFNTELLGLILERATGKPPSRYLQEKIWQPIGMEYPATLSIDGRQDDFEITPILLNARAIDLAKFGRLYLDRGNWEGRQIIPERWVVESTAKDSNDHRPWETFSQWQLDGGYYKFFWWGISRGRADYSYMGIGTYGQFIFVSPRARVVIVRTANADGIDPRNWREVFQYIADQIGQAEDRRQTPAPTEASSAQRSSAFGR